MVVEEDEVPTASDVGGSTTDSCGGGRSGWDGLASVKKRRATIAAAEAKEGDG
jgi:hypothetical protein